VSEREKQRPSLSLVDRGPVAQWPSVVENGSLVPKKRQRISDPGWPLVRPSSRLWWVKRFASTARPFVPISVLPGRRREGRRKEEGEGTARGVVRVVYLCSTVRSR